MFLLHLTSSPHFYTFLYAAICFFAALNLFEVAYLLLHQHRQDLAEARKAALKHKISTALITEEDPAKILPPPGAPEEYEAYGDSVATILESFEGEIAERATQLVYTFGIDTYYKRLSRSGAWYRRAHSIDILSSLKLKKTREFLIASFVRETSDVVRYRILYGLSLLVRDSEDVYSLCELTIALPYLTAKYTEDIFYNSVISLKNCGAKEEYGRFLERIKDIREIRAEVKRDCLSACLTAGCEHSGDIVRAYCKAYRQEPAIFIVCLKILASVGDFTYIHEALMNKNWLVRLTAVKYAHLCQSSVLPDLQLLLHDRNYHIRMNAALVCAKLGQAGLALLAAESASSDKFASDAAKYALTGAGGAA